MTPTGEQLADYFGEISHNDADIKRIIGVFLISAIWILVVIYLTKGENIKGYIKNKFFNLKTRPNLSEKKVSSGYVYDINNNQILTMDMNPINSGGGDIFVPKYGNGDKKDTLSTMGAKVSNKQDLITEINTFINLVVKGDQDMVFNYPRLLKDKNISIENFASSAILELDDVLRSRMDGEVNKHNAVLSQIVSHWDREKVEVIIGALLTIVNHSYFDQTIGVKVALMRMLKS